jgi:hypothetical protein
VLHGLECGMLEDVEWLQRLANFYPIDESQEEGSRRSSRPASSKFDGENAAILLDDRQPSSSAAATVASVVIFHASRQNGIQWR